ncbi:fimbria/pilus outer membrane usher protein [Vibrio sp.]|nr:fimbria/pilus outer membrane usher protein [Vibrio sp.]
MLRQLFLLSILYSAHTLAQFWEFELPLTYQEKALPAVLVMTDGNVVSGYHVPSLVKALKEVVDESALETLLDNQSFSKEAPSTKKYLSEADLREKGIDITFSSEHLQLSVALDRSILKARTVEVAEQTSNLVPSYSPSTFWSLQNQINASTSYLEDKTENNSRLEVKTFGNVGGAQGVNVEANTFYDEEWKRGNTTLFWDNPSQPWRISAGDVSPQTIGHLPSLSLGGASWERNYSELQPSTRLTSGDVQSFILDKTADVNIFVNGVLVLQQRFSAGPIELNSLPLSSGSNTIRIDIQYLSGEQESEEFTYYYQADLLAKGLTDFSVTVGMESDQDRGEISYADTPLLSGFINHGLTEQHTIGLNGLYHNDGALLGIMDVTSYSWGNVDMRASASHSVLDEDSNGVQSDEKESSWGSALSLGYNTQVWGSLSHIYSSNLFVAYEKRHDFTSQPWLVVSSDSYDEVSLDHTYYLSSEANISWGGYYQWGGDNYEESQLEVDVHLRHRNWFFTFENAYTYNTDSGDEYLTSFLIEFFFDVDDQHQLTMGYDHQDEESFVELYRPSTESVGSYGYQVVVNDSPDEQSLETQVDYVANRFQTNMDWVETQDSYGNSVRNIHLNTSTAVAFSSHGVGVGRYTNGRSTMVDVHPTLADTDVWINPQDEAPQAVSTASLPNLVPLASAHETNIIFYEAPDAPIGYDLGEGYEAITPGTSTLHVIQVGADATKTLLGYVYFADKEPVSLLYGQLIDEKGQSIPIFTNRKGRFVAEGVTQGTYQIQFEQQTADITIEANSEYLVSYGDVYLTE